MASRTSRAAARLKDDQDRREDRPLKAVPDLTEDKDPGPAPVMTKGDAARKAARDALPPHQQAEYDRLTSGGIRHVTARAAARKVPAPEPGEDTSDPAGAAPVTVTEVKDPAPDPADVDKLAADMFAAFAAVGAGTGQGAADPAATVTAAVAAKNDDDAPDTAPKTAAPPRPVPAPKPAAPKPAPKPRPARPAPDGATAIAEAVPFDRYIGTVTIAGQVKDCEHGARNGHITVEAADGCAKKLLRAYPAGVPGHRMHDRYTGQYTAKTDGARPVGCGCRFGHKTADAAVACAKAKAAQAGLTA